MKKTNIILGIVIAIFVICAVSILIIAIVSNVQKEKVPTNIDFDALSASIEDVTNIDNEKMKKITVEELESEFGINSMWIYKYISLRPYVNISSSMYIIIEATDGNVDNILSAFKLYGKKYEDIWERYLPEEYELVKNRQIGAKGNYVYFIVSDYAKEIIDLIK